MAIKREGAALRPDDQAGDCNSLCVRRCAFCELHGPGRAVVIERLTQVRCDWSTDVEIMDVIGK